MDARTESPNLDFLRACAVLFVVCFHILLFYTRSDIIHKEALGGFYSFGNWGVLVFFVHTCLVLMFSLERQEAREQVGPMFSPFLLRRIFRLYPLSVLVVLFVAFFHLPVSDIGHGKFISAGLHWDGILANVLLVQNITHTDSIIAPLWSLPFEMQMYLFLPLLFLVVRSKRGLPIVLVSWVASVVIAMHSARLESWGALSLLIFVPFFLPGVLAYKLSKLKTLNLPAAGWPVFFACVSAVYLINPSAMRGGFCCLVLGLATPQFNEISWGWLNALSKTIARYSYGIYLTHFACIWLAFQEYASWPAAFRWLVLVVTIVMAPIPLYHLLEEPMIRLGSRIAARMRETAPSDAAAEA